MQVTEDDCCPMLRDYLTWDLTAGVGVPFLQTKSSSNRRLSSLPKNAQLEATPWITIKNDFMSKRGHFPSWEPISDLIYWVDVEDSGSFWLYFRNQNHFWLHLHGWEDYKSASVTSKTCLKYGILLGVFVRGGPCFVEAEVEKSTYTCVSAMPWVLPAFHLVDPVSP